MLPVPKDLLADKKNLIEITSCNKEHYQYPGYHSSNHSSVLYFTSDVTQLPHYSESHFLWYDIQLSKSSTSKNKATIKIDCNNEEVFYWMSKCKGVEKCEQFNHVVPNSFNKNNCKTHPCKN